ncbi:MAG: LysR family transcriptional regulator [Eubacterium sp.]|nr:LysR family transcriptional regulator [Eubacterium sp.]
MNFRNLKYFLEAAEAKNITHAARKLFISQQSLSEHITRLEEELGVTLFERGPELGLTYAGERLYLLAKRICSLEQEIIRETGEISDHRRGRLRLGISYTCSRSLLPLILPEFYKEHPMVEINLMEGNHQKLNEWLEQGEIDVLLGYLPIDVPGAEVYPLIYEKLLLASPKAMTEDALGESAAEARKGGGAGLDIRAFRDQPFILLKTGNRIRTLFDVYAERNDFFPSVIIETENIETAFALAESGMGVTAYPEMFLMTLHRDALDDGSKLDLLPLYGGDTTGIIAIAFMEKGYHSPAVLDFIDLCRQKSDLWQEIGSDALSV